MVSDMDLVTRLQEILVSSDLDTATPASIRRQLEADFGVDLTNKKAFIRDKIDAFLESKSGTEDKPESPEADEDINANEITEIETEIEEDEDDDGREGEKEQEERPVKTRKRGGGFTKVSQLSPQLEKVVGTSQLARTEVVKKMWAYIRENDLQDPKDRRKIVCNELLHSLFRVKKINMFQMNKALTKHIWPLGDEEGCANNVKEEDEDEASEGTDKKGEQNEEVEENNKKESEDEEVRSLRKRKRNKPAKSVEKPKRKGGGGFTKVCSLSPELQAFTGVTELARTEVVKMLWKYIKENNLQDPNNGRTIICDESLRSLFSVESINMFQMSKQLSKHIWPLEDNAGCANNVKEEEEDDEDGASEGTYEKEEQNEEVDEHNERESEDEEVRSLRKSKREKPAKSVEKPKKKVGGGFTKVCSLSPELQAFTGVTELARTEVVKMLWKYIKENNLQDPNDGRRIICNESLRSLFHVESINMFQMSKHLTKHIWPLEDNAGESVGSNFPKNGKQKMESDGDTECEESNKKDKRRKKEDCGLLAPLPLSDALVRFLGNGESSLSRADVVKNLWEYIKQNDLQDRSDKRKIICDEKLKELFEVDSFEDSLVSKLLTNHFIKTEE